MSGIRAGVYDGSSFQGENNPWWPTSDECRASQPHNQIIIRAYLPSTTRCPELM